MKNQLIKNATIINEGQISQGDVLVRGERIEHVGSSIQAKPHDEVIDASGLYLIPGLIDTHVHFREPGLSYKGTIDSESKAAVAGGVTSYMEMPNTLPNATTMEHLEEKYRLASQSSYANYSFYFGLNAQNLEEALRVDNALVCGLTDDGLYFDQKDSLLCNNPAYLKELFSRSGSLIALHCEDENIIGKNETAYRALHGKNIQAHMHAEIRSSEACYAATGRVVEMARLYNARLHILHVSTGVETSLFDHAIASGHKRITAEACIHHLYFNSGDYGKKGMRIKWNPSIKSEQDRVQLLEAIRSNRIDTIATDHAPHLLTEKLTDYFNSKSGAPSVQHTLPVLTELYHRGEISLEDMVEKTSHHPADIFCIRDRGYIREGYYADLVLFDLHAAHTIAGSDLLYTCGWSPFEHETLRGVIDTVMVNGSMILRSGKWTNQRHVHRLIFNQNR
ncbi:MAG: dihydroorotase [Bacteroidetes bacterium]|nr:dihydroorotase [Bacteroidota bacterium]